MISLSSVKLKEVEGETQDLNFVSELGIAILAVLSIKALLVSNMTMHTKTRDPQHNG